MRSIRTGSASRGYILLLAVLFSLLGVKMEAHAGRGMPWPPTYTATGEQMAYSIAYLDSMAIELQPGSDRPFLFSGNGTTFYYGTTKTLADEGWMGFHWGGHKLFDDFILTFNGEPMDRCA